MDTRTGIQRAVDLFDGSATKLAAAINDPRVVRQHVENWLKGGRVSADRAQAVRLATQGRVELWDLRPDDWHRIWPELIDAAGAPAVAETAKAGA